jgi:hypothetical protein
MGRREDMSSAFDLLRSRCWGKSEEKSDRPLAVISPWRERPKIEKRDDLRTLGCLLYLSNRQKG